MTGNSGSFGAFPSAAARQRYIEAMARLEHTLDTVEVVGWPKRNAELDELVRISEKYLRKDYPELVDRIRESAEEFRPAPDPSGGAVPGGLPDRGRPGDPSDNPARGGPQ